MLSYRHAFHAGNHADVLKHLTLMLALERLLEKADKPLVYIDTHAGAGMYDLADARAAMNAEYAGGIAPLLKANALPPPLARFVELIRLFSLGKALAHYPGSPAIARQMMATGRLELCELHPDEHARLLAWAGRERRIRVYKEDGFQRLKALLPPVERRALVLIDPSYELKPDYRAVVDALRGALQRFATGVYLLWYPLLERPELPKLTRALKQVSERWLMLELEVSPASAEGLIGSGMFVINPPWQLAEQLKACGPALNNLLCAPTAGGFSMASGPGKA